MAATMRERKEIERWRRQQMKGLCAKLSTLIPKQHHPSSKERMNNLDILDAAVAYIKELKGRVDQLQLQRQRSSAAQLVAAATGAGGGGGGTSTPAAATSGCRTAESSEGANEEMAMAAVAPVVVVQLHPPDESSLTVALVGGAGRAPYLKLHEVIAVLEEEGAEVLSANLSVASCKIFCIVHGRAFSSRIGIDASRVSERLRALV